MISEGRVRVLHFTNTLARGGVEEYILSLLHTLDRRLFQLFLACDPELVPRLKPDIPEDVEIFPLRLASPSDIAGAVQLAKVLHSRKIGILHSHMFQSSLFASPVGWLCRVPVIMETPHLRELWRKGWKASHFIDRMVGRTVDHYIAVSEANRSYLTEQKGLPAAKVEVIRFGLDVQRWEPSRPAPVGLKRNLGFADDDPVIVVAARLEPQKGHRVLLDAMPTVLREFPRARLVCVGDGSLRSELRQHASAAGIEDAVCFVGYQTDMADWYAIADFSVLPSFFEGLPLAAIESLAAGRTLVATAVDGTPEIVIDGHSGLTVPSGDAQALASAICRLLRDPELRRQMSRNGRELAMTRFSRQHFIEQSQQLYLRAWAQSGRELPAPAAAAGRS